MLSFLFKSKNKRLLGKLEKQAIQINSIDYTKLSDIELKEKTKSGIQNEVLAAIMEGTNRSLGMKPHTVQIIGVLALIEGHIAEMKTGEGKTLTAAMAATYLALSNRTIYVVTVNDYLAERDAKENSALFEFFDLKAGIILSNINKSSKEYKKEQYSNKIVYGTNSEFGFDYLRDNMVLEIEEKVQNERDCVLIDEVDSILIDEARTPLIVSGVLSNDDMADLKFINKISKTLIEGKEVEVKEDFEVVKKTEGDFILNVEYKSVFLTEEGIKKVEEALDIGNLFDVENSHYSHLVEQALVANHIFEEGKHYVVKDKEIVLIDENTGRLAEGRQLSNGLHQAMEAKEKLKVSKSNSTVAEISYQNFFKTFKSLSGMSGTAETEATEFSEIYDLEVLSIPTNKPILREDKKDLIFLSLEAKVEYLVKEVKRIHKTGQPILIGTTSVNTNNLIETRLRKEKLKIEVLNAKNASKESSIIEKAGLEKAITVATNMAGRGVDIKLNDRTKELGGLYIIGFERYDNRRIDNQLRGRSGRQGDPGASQFFVSLEDPMITIFGDQLKNTVSRLGFTNEDFIESRLITKSIEKAQGKIENLHFEGRKDLLKYDGVLSRQREEMYKVRDNILSPEYNIEEKIKEQITFITDLIIENEIDINEEDVKENLKNILQINLEGDIPTTKEEFEIFIHNEIFTKLNTLDSITASTLIKRIYLQNLDMEWRSHLTQLDTLRTGVGLRAINQKDPIEEYKKEAFHMFKTMIDEVKINIIKTLVHLTIHTEEKDYERLEIKE